MGDLDLEDINTPHQIQLSIHTTINSVYNQFLFSYFIKSDIGNENGNIQTLGSEVRPDMISWYQM